MLRLVVISAIFAVVTGIQPRIIDGDKIAIESYPYQVSLHYSGKFNCGGSIISNEWILTAGHCIDSAKAKSELTVRSGTSFYDRGGSFSDVDYTIVHEFYNKTSKGILNDVALVHLAEPLVFNYDRRPVPLVEKHWAIEDGTPATVTGWGRTSPRSKNFSPQLQKVKVPIVNMNKCHDAYKRIFFQPLVEGQICAGYLGVGGKDACKGDSGGPMVVSGYLAGIVSYGNGCGSPKFPGIYTDVAYYRDWIRMYSGV